MSNTTDFQDDSGRWWVFHHRSDYVGDITVNFPDDVRCGENQILIPFDAMRQLVGQWLRNELMAEIEDMDGIEFLESIGR